jgi:hypothetical protein
MSSTEQSPHSTLVNDTNSSNTTNQRNSDYPQVNAVGL